MQNQTEPQGPRHWTTRTHRVLGLSSLVFLILISASGLILNHADTLGMSRHAAPGWLLRIYNVEPPPISSAFTAGGVLFATSEQILFADGTELAKNADPLIGAAIFDGGLIAATSNEFFLTSVDAALVERFAPDMAGPMIHLGTDGQRIIVATQKGYVDLDPHHMTLSSVVIEPMDISWSRPVIPTKEQTQQLGAAALGQALNWERVLLDLHSGRILPTAGRYIADITAICLLYMCLTGVMLWFRRR